MHTTLTCTPFLSHAHPFSHVHTHSLTCTAVRAHLIAQGGHIEVTVGEVHRGIGLEDLDSRTFLQLKDRRSVTHEILLQYYYSTTTLLQHYC